MTEIFILVLIILVLTRIFGEISVRLGQTVLVGELLSGVLLGVLFSQYFSDIPAIANLNQDPVFYTLKNFGVFFIMLMAGMELAPKDLTRSGPRSGIIALFSCASATLFAFLLGWTFIGIETETYKHIYFISIILAITAVPTLMKTLIDLKLLDTEHGRKLVSSGVIVEIVALIGLVILTKLMELGHWPDFALLKQVIGQAAILFITIFLIGKYVYPMIGQALRKVVSSEFEFSAVIILALLFSLISEMLDMHFLIGAFMAGLFFEKSTIDTKTYNTLTTKIEGLTLGFFAPIFFASIGLQLDLSAISEIPFWIIALLLSAIGSKLLGGALPAYLMGVGKKESLMIGLGLTSKGSLDLIIAGLALEMGLFSSSNNPIIQYMFSSIVVMSITTTIALPIVLGWINKLKKF